MYKIHLPHASRLNLIRPTLYITIALSLFFNSGNSFAVNKCDANGNITYTDQPCPKEATILPYTSHVSPPDDPAAAKQRYLADKKKLDQINKQKAQEEKQLRHDAQAYEHQKKLAKDHELKCKNLDMKREIAHQQQIDAKHKGNASKIKKSQLQTQQAENNYAKSCKSE